MTIQVQERSRQKNEKEKRAKTKIIRMIDTEQNMRFEVVNVCSEKLDVYQTGIITRYLCLIGEKIEHNHEARISFGSNLWSRRVARK